jgi:hypothetical protein
MDIKQLKKAHKILQRIKPIYLIVIFFVFVGLAIYGLRSNYSKMVELRQAVSAADEQNGDVEKALQELRVHVYGHMNTNLSSGNTNIKPPIQLKARYERLVASKADDIKRANEAIAKQGELECAAKFPAGGYNAPRVACIQEYVAANASKVDTVPDELYKFDFISPRWSPDLAGWSLVAAMLTLGFLISRIIIGRIVERALD